MIRTVNIVHPFYEARSGRWFEKRKTVLGHDIYVFKSDFLRISRIGRHSRKIDFSFISPKHTFR